ncbi:665_t:CDS:10, partial [Dentiscutata erythropus]
RIWTAPPHTIKVDKQDNVTQALFDYLVEETKALVASTSGTSKTFKTSNLPEPEINERSQKGRLETSKLPESIEPISKVINAPSKETNSSNPINKQFLEKYNLTADSTPEQLNEHAPKLDVLLPDWMARRCVKVALARGTDNRRSFSEEQIEALLPDKRKGKLTIEEKAKYCAKIGDAMDIFTHHLDLDPKNNYENEIVASDPKLIQESNKIQKKQTKKRMANPDRILIHFLSARVLKRIQNMDVSKIPSKENLVDIIVMELLTWNQDAIKVKKLSDPVFTGNGTRNAWPFNEFLKQEPYRTIPKKLRDYGSKHAFRIHGGKKPTPQHLKLLSRITMRQESDHLDTGDNYAIGDTKSEEFDSEPKTSDSSKPQIQASSRDSESSTASIVRRIEKYNIRSPQEIPEEDMSDVDNREGEDNLFKSPHKRSFVDTSKNKLLSKKAKKQVKREDSPTLKKLIQELTSPTRQQVEGPITLQSGVSEMDISLLDFLDLYNKIDTAEDNLQRTTHDLIRCYYNFGQAIKQLFNHFRKSYNENVSNTRVNDRIRDQIAVQDKLTETNLRKRKERGKKVFRLFSNIGSIEAIEQIKSFNATTILNLPPDDVDFKTKELIDFLRKEEDLDLEEDDLGIISKEKINGCAFLKITKEKLRNYGMPGGPALNLADFAKDLSKWKLRAYSSYKSLKEVLKKYGLDSDGTELIPLFKIAKVTCEIQNSDKYFAHCMAEIMDRLKNYGSLVVDSLEAMRNEYVYEIVRNESTGRVDYAIKDAEDLICITEDKQHQIPMVVTTGRDWFFLLYSPDEILQGSKLPYTIEFTEDALNEEFEEYQTLHKSVRRVLGVVVSMLKDRVCVDKSGAKKKAQIEDYCSR